jgi:hypothetical protein
VSETTLPRPAEARPAEAPAGVFLLLRLFALPTFGFLLFGLLIATGLPSDRIGLAGVAIATMTMILMVTAVDRTRPRERRNLLLSILSFSFILSFLLPVFVFYLGSGGYDPDLSPNPLPLTPSDVARGVFAAAVGYAALLAGYALPIGSGAANFLPRMKREWSVGTSLLVAFVAIVLGWSVLLASHFGILPERAGSGLLGAIASGAMFGIALIALCYERYRSSAAFLMLILVIAPTMFFNFFTSSKFLFLAPLVMVVAVRIIVTRRLRGWWFAAALIIVALFYPVSQSYRNYMLLNHLSAVDVIVRPWRAFAIMGGVASTFTVDPAAYFQTGMETTLRRFDYLGILSVIMRDAGERVPFQNGRTVAFVPLSFIPRLLWPDKPLFDTGQWVTNEFGWGPHVESSTGCSWMGELYFNFGWGGVVVGMALLGIWFRFLQETFLRSDATIPAMLAGIVTILAIVPTVGGDLLAPTAGVIMTVAPIVLIHIVLGVLTPPPRQLPPRL